MQSGDWLGRYRIVRKIGEGGMGEVYLAEDPKLNRQIALKTLSADFAADSDRMMRFIHEAKSASALNHPNIITIYEIYDEDEVPFIAMEFVDGETLGRRIRNNPLEIDEALDVAVQITAALAAAHEAGIIHRDVKPDNVILRPDGLVKVLDFGLAKHLDNFLPSDPDAQTIANIKTHPGMVMGTVSYMSPEQSRGKVVDERTDIFSFGAVLYQMVAGRLPFAGDNYADVISSILSKEPRPLSQSARLIPEEIDSLIRKALRKNRDERYQTVREIQADLREVRDRLGFAGNTNEQHAMRISDFARGTPTDRLALSKGYTTGQLSAISGILFNEIKVHPLRAVVTGALAALILAASTFGIYHIAESSRKPPGFQTMRFTKLTQTGNIASAQLAVSPDGKYIAYVAQEGESQSLWVKQTMTSSNLQIVEPSGVKFRGVSFSPDASLVYYTVSEKDSIESIYQVPALGGNSRKLIENTKGPVAFSPDGKQIVFLRDHISVMTANTDGSNARIIANSSEGKLWLAIGVAWSPDGGRLAAAAFSPRDNNDHLVEINIADGSERPIPSPQWRRVRGVAWLPDGSGLIVNGRDPETQFSQLWIIGYPDGTHQRITNELSNYQGLSMTADGRNLVSTQQSTLSNIWVAKDGSDALKITSELGKSDGMSGLAWAPEGKVVYTTRIKETQDLWIINSDGTGNRQLTFNSGSNFSPVVSRDGRYIVFASSRAGNMNIWRMDGNGGNPLQLTNNSGIVGEPSISPDSRWVVYQHADADNKATIWRVSIDGGEPVRLSAVHSEKPTISPDGRTFACLYGVATPDSAARIAVIPIDGGEPVRLLDLPSVARSRTFRWSSDGSSLIYLEGKNGIDNLWSQPLAGGSPKQLTEFRSDRIFRFGISSVNGQIAFARGSDASDSVMISDFR